MRNEPKSRPRLTVGEKIDHMLSRQWEGLAEIREVQVELLADLSRARST